MSGMTGAEAEKEAAAFLKMALKLWDGSGPAIHATLLLAIEAPDIARATLVLIERLIGETIGMPAEMIETATRQVIRDHLKR